METLRYQDLSDDDRELVDAARTATETAYAPYSRIRVGAALRTGSGRVVTGSNVENAAYGATLCAERMAVGRANAEGERAFTAVAVTALGDSLPSGHPVAPCGTCRQVLHEMASVTGTSTRVLMATPGSDEITIASLRDLLPLAFDRLSR